MAQFDPNNYIDVQERINRFWSEYPNGAIRTYHISDIDNFEHCRYNAAIFKDRNSTSPDATGYAFEAAGGAGANRTSHEENCETSAIGRALANMGYAVTREDRPSRQEMTKVAAANGKPAAELVRPEQFDADAARMRRLHAVAADKGLSHDELHLIVVGRGKASLKDLTPQELDKLTNWMERQAPPAIQKAIDAGRDPAPLGAK